MRGFSVYTIHQKHHWQDRDTRGYFDRNQSRTFLNAKTNMRLNLKLRIVELGLKHQLVALKANKNLAPESRLTELDITKIITQRKEPTPAQARALARALHSSVPDLFPGEFEPPPAQPDDQSNQAPATPRLDGAVLATD